MFFAGRDDVCLLELTLDSPLFVQEEPDRKEAAGRAAPTVHCLPDGCQHIFYPAEQPTKWCAMRKYPLPLRAAGSDGGGAGDSHEFPPQCVVSE
jgi:hypothetical protein